MHVSTMVLERVNALPFSTLTLGEWGNSIYTANLIGYWRDANLPSQIGKRGSTESR